MSGSALALKLIVAQLLFRCSLRVILAAEKRPTLRDSPRRQPRSFSQPPIDSQTGRAWDGSFLGGKMMRLFLFSAFALLISVPPAQAGDAIHFEF